MEKMPEQKPKSLYQQQKAIKPLIEDIIPEHLDVEMQKLALDLIGFMRANKIKPTWNLTNSWKSVSKGRCICYIHLFSGNSNGKNVKWIVTPYLEHVKDYEDTIIAEGLQDFLWNNVLYCVHKPIDSLPPMESRNFGMTLPCNLWNCAPGKTITICCKELTNICRNSNRQHFWFHDPDQAAIDCIKRLLELEKKAR